MKFFEVFSNITTGNETRKLAESAVVDKIKTNSRGSLVIIMITVDHIIPKMNIIELEEAISIAYFNEGDTIVEIRERFVLSGQYTPRALWNEYKDSVFMELKRISAISGVILRDAEITFTEDDEMYIATADSPIARKREPEIRGFLQGIFFKRCNLPVRIEFGYVELEEDPYRENAEYKINALVDAVTERLYKQESEEDDGEIATYGEDSDDKKKEKKKKKEKDAGETNKLVGKSKHGDYKKGGKNDTVFRSIKKCDNENIVYGREFTEDYTPIQDIVSDLAVVIRGKVFAMEDRALKSGKHLFIFSVTDFTDSIQCKIFTFEEQKDEFLKAVKVGDYIKVKGVATYDSFSKEICMMSIYGIAKISDFTTKRLDLSKKKRVELHCHTKSSDMDGVSYAKDIIKRADSWGWSACAITDHGVVQAFPEALHTLDDLNKGRENPFKVLYGCEGYLVDDLTEAVINENGQTLNDSFVVFDIETTGFSPIENRIIEIGAVRVKEGVISDKFSVFVNPKVPIPFEIQNLTHINDHMVENEPTIEEILPRFLEFVGDDILVAHNANFDMSFIIENCKRLGIEKEFTYVDTLAISRSLLTKLGKHQLGTICKELGIKLEDAHRAVNDAGATAEVFARFIKMLEKKKITTLKELNAFTSSSTDRIMKSLSYHVIILAKNETWRQTFTVW